MLATKKIFCIILLFFSLQGEAQNLYINGTIKDNEGAPVPFATILIKGTRKGAQADMDGQFRIITDKKAVTLQLSAVGYTTVEKKLNEKDFKDSVANISILIGPVSKILGETVVVSAFGTVANNGYDSREYKPVMAAPAKKIRKSIAPGSAGLMDMTERYTVAAGIHREEKGKHKSYYADKKGEPTNSSLLTAGEVNDFTKWKMWEDYNSTDFNTYSEKWDLYTSQRFSVQLQNNERKAVVGQTVYLVNKDTKEIVWTAVSDNTGKAELWNGFSNNSKEKNLAIEVKGEKRQFIAVPFSQGLNHIKLDRNCAVTNKIEISFVVDATGSMGDEIEYLKEELGDVLHKFSMKDPSLDLFTSAVFYRDKGDDYITATQPFSKNIQHTVDFIQKQSAGGGGDYPEALKEALQDATQKLAWSADARTKIIFLLMDAPPHDEAKNELAILISGAAAKGIRIVPVACSGTDKATEFIMRSMALATNGTYLFLTDDSGIGNPHIKPTTDQFKVELLNDLLQRIMEQMCFVNTCDDKKKTIEPSNMYSNTLNVKVFPNPTQGPVTLETDKELAEIFVADFTGKIIMRLPAKDIKKRYKIDLSGFPSATYFIRYVTKDNKTGAEKIVLIH
jgi:CarboxypepD_reg-like domain/Secretion system C-terminal sorting domain/von Willebrand factor type A domain